ncbi:MAG: universal stress protein [Bdellovibrionota bacterium]
MKHILVPTDFSNASKTAFAFARKQAELLGKETVKVTLFAVLEDLIPASVQFEFGLTFIDSKGLLDEAEKQAEKRIEGYRLEYFKDLNVETRIVRAMHPVHAEIKDFIKKNVVDLVIMATHGRTGIRHLVLGSVTERVVREATCPVLVVPSMDESSAKGAGKS